MQNLLPDTALESVVVTLASAPEGVVLDYCDDLYLAPRQLGTWTYNSHLCSLSLDENSVVTFGNNYM